MNERLVRQTNVLPRHSARNVYVSRGKQEAQRSRQGCMMLHSCLLAASTYSVDFLILISAASD